MLKIVIKLSALLLMIFLSGCVIVNPPTLDFGSDETTMTFTITVNGNVEWSITPSESWITVDPDSGQDTTTVSVTVDRTGLDGGYYEGTLFISTNPDVPATEVIVQMTVGEVTTSTTTTAAAAEGDPVLYFSDITSGPKTGNSDDSGGRSQNEDGAIVTIWGVNLGSVQESSKVTCNGADAASYYFWGNATAPADLYSYHKMQMVSFEVSHLAQDGAGEIIVTVNDKKSNPLNFTVRTGNIYFIKTTGDDNNGNGSWTQPWRTIPTIVNSIQPGDIAYVCNAVNQTTESIEDTCVYIDEDIKPTETNPKALVVYPGAQSTVGSVDIPRAFLCYTTHWVISKFNVMTSSIGLSGREGFRIVGNHITAPKGDGPDGAIECDMGDNLLIAGNELTNVGDPDSSHLYHAIYVSGLRTEDSPRAKTESNKIVAWNYIHDCDANRALDFYSEGQYSAFIQQISVHDNVIINQRGDGILFGYYVTGDNWIYNNLIIKSGKGPEWKDPSYNTGIHIDSGHEGVPKTDIYCYNNTLYGCGFTNAVYPEQTGNILISSDALQRGSTIHLSNNIIYSTGEAYIASESTSPPSGNYRNCWYGNGDAPSWDQTAIASDPEFQNVSSNDFSLKGSSPCINTAVDVTNIVSRDLLGIPRPQGAVDLGVYEYSSTAEDNEAILVE